MIAKKTIRLIVVSLLIPLSTFLFISSNEGTGPRLSRKMDQVVKKIWNDIPVERTPFLIPPNLKPGADTEIFKLTSNNQLLGYMVLNKAYSCRVGGCSVWSPVEDQTNYDPFYYVVIVNPDLTINTIKVIEYYSEYGYEITSKQWLAQFTGKKGCNLQYQKNIDGITGATISAKSMIHDVNSTCEMMEQLDLMNVINNSAN